MSVFNRLFGSKDPLDQLRRAVRQQRWADALVYADALSPEQLTEAAGAEYRTLRAAAGDALGALNLEEAEACLRSGELHRAAEHFQLAVQQACSSALRERIAASRADTEVRAAVKTVEAATTHDCRSSCNSGCPPGEAPPAPAGAGSDLDQQTRWELLLATFPPALAERYSGHSPAFQQAVLAGYEGGEVAALDLVDV